MPTPCIPPIPSIPHPQHLFSFPRADAAPNLKSDSSSELAMEMVVQCICICILHLRLHPAQQVGIPVRKVDVGTRTREQEDAHEPAGCQGAEKTHLNPAAMKKALFCFRFVRDFGPHKSHTCTAHETIIILAHPFRLGAFPPSLKGPSITLAVQPYFHVHVLAHTPQLPACKL